jgi:hypothetical protein
MTSVGADLSREIGDGDGSELCTEQRFGLLERAGERAVHGLLDETARALVTVADGEDRRLAERLVDVPQRDVLELLAERPASAVPLLRAHDPRRAEPSHGPPDHDGVRVALRGHLLGRQELRLRHMQQRVHRDRQPAVPSHVTLNAT